eukprot:3591850-Pleurochrysis_carterae.AAC.1
MAYLAMNACQEIPTAVFASRGLVLFKGGRCPRIYLYCKGMAENIWRDAFSIRQVQAGRSTPSMAFLANNGAHGLYAAFYACHGSPYFIKFGALARRRTSSSQEKHQLSQVSEILFYPRLLP